MFIQWFSGDNLSTIAIQRDLEPVYYAVLWITLGTIIAYDILCCPPVSA
ncbi:hypothetical protein VPHD260_0194 [Vibrio phage D260]